MTWGALGKNVFAECRAQEALGKICFQKIKKIAECPRMALGKVFFLKIKTNFAECLMAGTRQNLTVGGRRHGPAKFCRAPGFAECQALGNVQICRVQNFAECYTRQNIALPSATIFCTRQSIRHSAKYSFLVVLLTSEETRFILFMYKDSRILYPHCKYHNPYIILKYSIRLQ